MPNMAGFPDEVWDKIDNLLKHIEINVNEMVYTAGVPKGEEMASVFGGLFFDAIQDARRALGEKIDEPVWPKLEGSRWRVVGMIDGEIYRQTESFHNCLDWAIQARPGVEIGQPIKLQYWGTDAGQADPGWWDFPLDVSHSVDLMDFRKKSWTGKKINP